MSDFLKLSAHRSREIKEKSSVYLAKQKVKHAQYLHQILDSEISSCKYIEICNAGQKMLCCDCLAYSHLKTPLSDFWFLKTGIFPLN